MAATLSRKDAEEIKPQVDKTVQKFLGFSEPSLVTTALNCLTSGYDKIKTARMLSSLLDESKSLKLADKIFEIADTVKNNSKSRKRHGVDIKQDDPPKKVKNEENSNNSQPAAGQLTDKQIKEMMANAQKMIEERKRALAIKTAAPMVEPGNAVKMLGTAPTNPPPGLSDEKSSRIAQLQANIKNRLSSNTVVGILNNVAVADKPTPLILDSQGRTVDITGKEVQLTQVTPTLKANIRAKKREEFKAQLNQQAADASEAHFFDQRIAAKPTIRNKRALKFHEPGKFTQMAERMRMKAQLEKLQNEIFQVAKKTGISSAAKLALIKTPDLEDHIPEIEWWDFVILTGDSYPAEGKLNLKEEAITNLVEHPTQMRPPNEGHKANFLPVFLTKKERKKLRRQNRREAWKEEQEKIRLGLEPPPEPKLRISNLMRVLGTEAVQDPTKMEAHVRAQMAKRQKAHEEANASRKLTAAQRKQKKVRKLKEDTSLGVHVAVYRITELYNPSKKFKVETNAKQLFLTGCIVLFKDCNIVVVEGGPKQINKYNRLMVHRIKWEEDIIKNVDGKEVPNKCVLVWKGTIKQRNFGEIKFKVCPTEKLGREYLKSRGVEHYWDLAYSGCVLDNADDLF